MFLNELQSISKNSDDIDVTPKKFSAYVSEIFDMKHEELKKKSDEEAYELTNVRIYYEEFYP